MGVLAAMLICLITYSVYIQSLKGFDPQNTYEVYDSLGGAQARLLMPREENLAAYNGGCSHSNSSLCAKLLPRPSQSHNDHALPLEVCAVQVFVSRQGCLSILNWPIDVRLLHIVPKNIILHSPWVAWRMWNHK